MNATYTDPVKEASSESFTMGMVPHQTLELMLDKLEDTYGNTRRTVESQIILEKPDSHGTRTKQQGKQRSSEGSFFSSGVRQ